MIAMINTLRYVNIRGYTRHVTVKAFDKKNNEYTVICSDGIIEKVPEHLFYHIDKFGFLILRDMIGFDKSISVEQEKI